MLIRKMTASILQQHTRRTQQGYLRKRLADTAMKPFSAAANKGDKNPMKPWKQSVVECHGDYRAEAWIEKDTGGPLYQFQETLPRLPVNDIQETLDRLVPTALPLAKTKQEEENLLNAIQQFPTQAQPLQQRLQQRAQEYHDSSWLQHWWNTMGYLQVRDSVVINVSYFFDFINDPTARTQVERAAALLFASGCYRRDLCSGSRPADQIGKKKTPLCSTAYKYMFHACRIPQLEQDSVKIYDPSIYTNAVVSRKGQFYTMDFIDPATQQPYAIDVLEQGLQDIINMADSNDKNYPQLGWLTSGNRDDWAKGRDVLLKSGGDAMAKALATLESGAILICLDDAAPVSKQETALLLLHGGNPTNSTDTLSPANRWFDKSIQLTVTANGKAGFTGEHSLMDGMPCVAYCDYVTKMNRQDCLGGGIPTGNCNPKPIFADVFDNMSDWSDVESVVEKAKSYFFDFTSSYALHTESFHGYGSDFIKKAGFSPDAFVQMAMQVATYRLWDGEQGGTYEATQVRPFLHGRTETTRSVSTESAAFCKRMGLRPLNDEDDPTARAEKLQLLQAAVDAHVKYIGAAAKAQGVDRHLLGLQLSLQDGEEAPALYSDPVFQRAKRWRVSTSHLTHPKFANWGYGPVVDDGVGLSYSIHPRHCVFNVTSLAKHGWTDKLCFLLEEAMLELRTLVELDMASKGPQSKL